MGATVRLDEAAARLAVERAPHSARAWETLGLLLVGRGELTQGRDCLEAALRIDPHSLSVLNNLAVVLQRLGQLRAARACYRRALQRAPQNAQIQLNFAALQGALGCYRQGLESVEQVLRHSPGLPSALLLGSALELNMGRRTAALERVERALAIAPDELRIRTQRAEVLWRLGRYHAALEDCAYVLSKAPNDARALHVRALIVQGLDQPDAALEAFRLAEAAASERAAVITDRAWLLAELGRNAEALEALDQALALQPELSLAWYRRASLSRYTPGHEDLVRMAAIADGKDTPYQDRMSLCFALGRAYLDMGDGSQAFGRLEAGNRMKRAVIGYSPEADERRFNEIMATFSAAMLTHHEAPEDRSQRPIFVFGMPRSGTTLVEQILASHPLVHGIGEPTHLSDLAEVPGFLARVPGLSPRDLLTLGRRYIELAGCEVSDTLRLVDKMPMNFLYAGFISLILPDARMIHCRRDPLDTCLSCYSLLFTNGQEFSYDLGELGRFYRLYLQLMAHWRRVLPSGKLLEIDYEELVEHTEAQARKILEFCALPWDAGCLRFHQSTRRVTSASCVQVRSPLYATSVGRAQLFRRWLGPLEAALAEEP